MLITILVTHLDEAGLHVLLRELDEVRVEDLAVSRASAVEVRDHMLARLGNLEPLLLVADLLVPSVAQRAPLLSAGTKARRWGRDGAGTALSCVAMQRSAVQCSAG